MNGRTARRLRIERYTRWLIRNHPESLAPLCVMREYNRQVTRHNSKMSALINAAARRSGFVQPRDWERL